MSSPDKKVHYDVTYLGAGTYSNVVRVNTRCGTSSWSLALGISRVETERSIFTNDNKASGTIALKHIEDTLHELASGRLIASLRQPGFIPQYRTFVVDGRWFARYRDHAGSLTSKIHAALQKGRYNDAEYWRGFSGDDADVLVVCMGLGDKGAMDDDSILAEASHNQDAARKWLFTLQWSLLVAQRTFNFQHRDIKSSNIVLNAEGQGRSTFQLSLSSGDRARLALPGDEHLGNPDRRFCVERVEGELSAFVPKFIDLGFSNYVLTSLPNYADEPPLSVEDEVPVYGNVNAWFSDVSTYPSPDMLFLANVTDKERDFDSDLFSFGVAALELLTGMPAYMVNICANTALRESFIALCQGELEKMEKEMEEEDADRVRVLISKSARILYGYIQVMLALHGELLPPSTSPLRTTLLYRLLSRPPVFAFLDGDRGSQEQVMKRLGKIRATHSPDAIDYLASCLTWDKSSRGVFPGGPRAHPGMPGTLRLMWHPYFDALLSTSDEAAKSSATEHYTLRYRDPPTSADVVKNPRRFERITTRILSLEIGLLRQVDDIYDGARFETEMDAFIADTLAVNTRVNASMSTDDDKAADGDNEISPPPPLKKKARKGSFDLLGRLRRPSLWADEETL